MDDRMDLVYRILDDQLIDVEGDRCGRVDDIEFEGDVGGPVRVTGLLSGRGTYPDRLPRWMRKWAVKMFGEDTRGHTVHRVPWEEIDHVDTTVHLKRKASEMDLGSGDLAMRPFVEKLPGS